MFCLLMSFWKGVVPIWSEWCQEMSAEAEKINLKACRWMHSQPGVAPLLAYAALRFIGIAPLPKHHADVPTRVDTSISNQPHSREGHWHPKRQGLEIQLGFGWFRIVPFFYLSMPSVLSLVPTPITQEHTIVDTEPHEECNEATAHESFHVSG